MPNDLSTLAQAFAGTQIQYRLSKRLSWRCAGVLARAQEALYGFEHWDSRPYHLVWPFCWSRMPRWFIRIDKGQDQALSLITSDRRPSVCSWFGARAVEYRPSEGAA
jgi:hypothetical protein